MIFVKNKKKTVGTEPRFMDAIALVHYLYS